VLIATAVTIVGSIGFVSLVTPHLVRLLIGLSSRCEVMSVPASSETHFAPVLRCLQGLQIPARPGPQLRAERTARGWRWAAVRAIFATGMGSASPGSAAYPRRSRGPHAPGPAM